MTLNLQTPFPTFGGSTGGWLRSAEVEEKYAITWTSPKEQIFEMPTGGAAIMRNGENLLYLARKEQCLALGTQLRTFKINNYKIYRIFPSGEVQYLHPKDGVFLCNNYNNLHSSKEIFIIKRSKIMYQPIFSLSSS